MASTTHIILLLMAIFCQGYNAFTVMPRHRVIVRLIRYENPGSKNFQRKNCDGWFGGGCDYRFNLCLGTRNLNCRYYKHSYGQYKNAADSFYFNPKISIELTLTELTEPLLLYVNVFDEDAVTLDDYVDRLYGSSQLQPGRRSHYIQGSHTKLFYDVNVICSHGWRGPYCNQVELPGIDWKFFLLILNLLNPNNEILLILAICLPGCNLRHGYCNGPNECLCQLGWQGHLCDQAICSPTCHPRNGYCNQPNECRCHRGWSGKNCIIPICRRGCSPYQGYCHRPFECRCNFGWTGPYCNQAVCRKGCHATHGYCNTPNECLCKQGWGGQNCNIDLANNQLTVTIKPVNISLERTTNLPESCHNISQEWCTTRLMICLIAEGKFGNQRECQSFLGKIRKLTHDNMSYAIESNKNFTEIGNNWRELMYNLPSEYYCQISHDCKPLGIHVQWTIENVILSSFRGYLAVDRMQLNRPYNMSLNQPDSHDRTFITYILHMSLTRLSRSITHE
ncbi:Wnt inhibitory factor 1 [Trichoplax sp. H2]|nr:Wnt inhibitory factor 1 [Trichoplax sp. H2]|eukprot:RDD40186.1 Wnt inhibitory factor 1 [Trichoplax sp. H2]